MEHLTISSEADELVIPHLGNQSNLKYFSLPKAITNVDFLEQNHEIEMISICNTNIENIKGLENCQKLKVIYFIDCKN